jgi:hypothetical protein
LNGRDRTGARLGLLNSDPLEIAAASEHWRRITGDMREAGTLSPTYGHMRFQRI